MPPSPAFYTPSLFTSFLNSRVLFLVFCASKNTKLFTVHMLYLGLNVSDRLKNSFFPSLYAFEHPHNHNRAHNLSLSKHTLTRTQTHLYVHPPRRSKSTHRASAFFYFTIFKKWRDNPHCHLTSTLKFCYFELNVASTLSHSTLHSKSAVL